MESHHQLEEGKTRRELLPAAAGGFRRGGKLVGKALAYTHPIQEIRVLEHIHTHSPANKFVEAVLFGSSCRAVITEGCSRQD